jgi:hypothetical protein
LAELKRSETRGLRATVSAARQLGFDAGWQAHQRAMH